MNLVLLVVILAAVAAALLTLYVRAAARRGERAEPGRGPLTDAGSSPPPLEEESGRHAADATPASTSNTVPAGGSAADADAAQEMGADFYDEVVRLLESELQSHPNRSDLRFKLLEMYAATHRKSDYLALAREHGSTSAGRQDSYWPRIAETGRQLLPGEALFAEPQASAPNVGAPREAPRKFRRYYDAVDPALLSALETELHAAFQELRQAASFWKQLRTLHVGFTGPRPPVVHVEKLSSFVGGAQIYVRHDPTRTAADAAVLGAVGQVLLAQSMGRKTVIAAPAGAGHAVAVARAAQKLKLRAQFLVTEPEQESRAEELRALGEAGGEVLVIPDAGTRMESQRAALSRALHAGSEAIYVSPIEAGPYPYPMIVQELQGLAGRDLKSQVTALAGRPPDGVIVSTADGMPAIGVLQAFLGTRDTKLYCVEAGQQTGSAPHRLGREHAWLRASGRVRYSSVPEEVARFAARHCMPDGIGDLHLAGGEVLVETFTLSRQFTPDEVVAVVIPAAPQIAGAAPAEDSV